MVQQPLRCGGSVRAIRYTDRVIDALLAHPNGYKNLLRRYRNGIYHYQRELLDSRLLTFLGTGDEHVLWVQVLHREFQRLLRQHVERCCPDEGSKAELKAAIQDLTGYHPDEPTRRHMEATLARALKVENTEPSPELREQHAEIQGSVADLALALASFDAKHQIHRLELLRRLGIEVVEE